MLKLQDVRQVQVELTTRCNARCPMCMRNYRGFDYNSGYPVCELTLEQFQHILSPEFLAIIMGDDPAINGFVSKFHGKRGVSFNGNLGDFSNAKDGVEIVQYLISHNVPVYINTNGSTRTPDWWAKMALPGVTIGFALDGLADTHSLYRQDTNWQKIIDNATAFISAGGNALWRFVPFEHNKHQETECKQLAEELGFAGFENIYDGRDTGPVYTRTGEYSHFLGEKQPGDNPPIKALLENHITWYDSKTVKHPKDTPELNLMCIHKQNREIFLAADGTVYPCCYLGFYPATMNHPGNKELAPLVQENNALEYSLEHCLKWFDAVEASWKAASIAEGRTYQCVATCNRI